MNTHKKIWRITSIILLTALFVTTMTYWPEGIRNVYAEAQEQKMWNEVLNAEPPKDPEQADEKEGQGEGEQDNASESIDQPQEPEEKPQEPADELEVEPGLSDKLDKKEMAEEQFVDKGLQRRIDDDLRNGDYTATRFIIKYKDGSTQVKTNIRSLAAEEFDVKSLNATDNRKVDILEMKESLSLEELEVLAEDPAIEYIQPDYEMEAAALDPKLIQQWGHEQMYEPPNAVKDEEFSEDGDFDVESGEATTKERSGFFQRVVSGVKNFFSGGTSNEVEEPYRMDANVISAWEASTGEGVIVAVLDTGIETSHEDLATNMLNSGFDFFNHDDSVNDTDNKYDQWHGTMIAGIIGAQRNNGIGIAGVAPGAKILPLKVFEGGTAYTSDIIEAIAYAEEQGAKVVNCSWGSRYYNPALEEAMADSDMLFVCAAGNSLYNIDNYPVYPASFELDNVISVASIDRDGRLSRFSNYGMETVDITAPGNEILSTWIDDGYEEGNGTSMAAAYVSGLAALVCAQNEDMDAASVKEWIHDSGDQVTGLIDKVKDGKKINCTYAVSGNTSPNENVIDVPDESIEELEPGEIQEGDDFELYADGYVSAKASMRHEAHGLSANVVNNKIYVIGGKHGTYTTSWAAEYDPATDTWDTINSSAEPRGYHGSFVYDDKICVLGGHSGTRYLNTVEIYDPVADTWITPQKNGVPVTMPVGLAYFTTTQDPTTGKVYLIGGNTANGVYSNAVYEYDPQTHIFAQKPSITTKRSNHTAFYYNGKIYIEGGIGTGGAALESEEQYVISTGATISGGRGRTNMIDAASVATADRAILMGGKTSTTNPLYTSEIIHSSLLETSDTYVKRGHMNIARSGLAAAYVNGKVYLMGGMDGSGALTTVEEIDLGWTQKASLPVQLKGFRTTEVNGKIYVLGGYKSVNGTDQISSDMYEYNPIINQWQQKANLPSVTENYKVTSAYGKIYLMEEVNPSNPNPQITSNRMYEYDSQIDEWTLQRSMSAFTTIAMTMHQGKIYLTGCSADGSSQGRGVKVYDPINSTWVTKNDLPETVPAHFSFSMQNYLYLVNSSGSKIYQYNENADSWNATNLSGGRSGNLYLPLNDALYMFGYRGNNIITPDVMQYRTENNSWSYYKTFNFVGPLNEIIGLNNKAYMFTGENGYSINLVEYSVSTSPWAQKKALPESFAVAGTAMAGGKIYTFGGVHYAGTTAVYHKGTYEYNPIADSWTQKADMPAVRSNLAAASASGKLYAIGGRNATTAALTTVTMYDPATNTWTSKAALTAARADAAACEANGKIYVFGGRSTTGAATNTVYEYNPTTNKWATKKAMTTARYGAGATCINGKIYVAGGFKGANDTTPTNVLEVYDPSANTWASKTSLPTALGYAGTTGSDTLYVISGTNGTNELNLVYEYSPLLDRWLTWAGPNGMSYQFGAAVTDEGLYAIGGRTIGGAVNGVEFAPIQTLRSDFLHMGEETVNLSGNFSRTYTDLEYTAPGFTVKFSRTYNSMDQRPSSISPGWTFGMEGKITEEGNDVVVRFPNGGGQTFSVDPTSGTYTAKDSRSTLVKQSDGTRILTTSDQYTYGFNTAGYMTYMKDRNGNAINITVDSSGKVTKVTDQAGKVTNIVYTSGRINKITDPAGRSVTYAYDTSNRLSKVTDTRGYETIYAYYTTDAEKGLLKSIKDHYGHTLEFIYYDLLEENEVIPKVGGTQDIYGGQNSYFYDKIEGTVTLEDDDYKVSTTWFDKMLYPIRTRDKEGQETTTSYLQEGGINKYGEAVSFIDRNGNITYYDRDGRGNIIRVLNPDGSQKTFTYDNKNNLLSEVDEMGKRIDYLYDAGSINLVRKVQPLNGTDVYSASADQSHFAITNYNYYTAAEALSQTGKTIYGLLKTETDPEGGSTTYTYDSYGNPATKKNALNKTANYQYNVLGLLKQETSIQGYVTKYYYDRGGNLLKKVLHGGETERFRYDANGNLVQKITANQYASGSDTAATFDAQNILNNAAADTYVGTTHGYRYVYNPDQTLKNETDPLGNVTGYTYDIYGNVLTETLPNGGIYTCTYDVMDRLKTRSFKESTASPQMLLESYDYEITPSGESEITQTQYASDSKLSTTKETYDYAGRLVKTVNPDGGVIQNTYNANGTLAQAMDAGGYRTISAYDGLNRETKRWVEQTANQYRYEGMEYDKAGNLKRMVIGKDAVSNQTTPSSNLATESYLYDTLGRITEKSDSAGGRVSYIYTDNDNIVTERVYTGSTTYNESMNQYDYLDNLKERRQNVASSDLNSGATSLITSYTYDKEGNLLTEKRADNVTITYTYDPLGRQLTASMPGANENNISTIITSARTYDLFGNVLTEKDVLDRTTKYEYDKRGLLIKTTDAKNGISLYIRDRVGKITAKVSPKNYVTSASIDMMSRSVYEYNLMGQVRKEQDIYKDQSGAWKTITKEFSYDKNGNILTEKDGLNHETAYEYDGENRLLTAKSPEAEAAGRSYSQKITYDALGRITSEWDGNYVATAYIYNDQGCLLTKKVENRVVEAYTYDLAGNLLTAQDGNGNITTYNYNSFGMMKNMTLPGDDSVSGITLSYQYTNLGQKAKEESSLGRINTYTYNNQGQILSQAESKSNGTEPIINSMRYDQAGNLRYAVDGRGNTTEYTYDELNRNIGEKRTVTINGVATSQTTNYVYDANGNQISVTDWRGNSYTTTYDALNRIIERKDPSGAVIERIAYNNNHQQVTSVDALDQATIFAYDKDGKLISTTDPLGNTIRQTYDFAGNIKTTIDGKNNVTTNTYDNLNHLISVKNALDEVTNYTYDNAGNLLTQTDAAGKVTTFQYNVRNLPTKKIDFGGIEAGEILIANRVESYSYYADGAMASKIDRNNVITTYSYDIHGRLLTENAGGEIVSRTYDNNGNELTMTDSTGTTTRVYDQLGRVTQKTVPVIGTSSYLYDQTSGLAAGCIAEKSTDPKGHVVTKVSDAAGRLYQVQDGTETTIYTYYANGNRQKVIYPSGASEEYTYYANNLLKTLANKQGGSILEAYSYTYDGAGNMTQKVDGKGTTAYTYDNLNRLLTYSEPGNKTTSYTYDQSGNRTLETIISPAKTETTAYTYNEQNRLTSTEKTENPVGGSTKVTTTEFFYDPNGNVISSVPYVTREIGSTNLSPTGALYVLGQSGAPEDIGALYEYDKRNNMVKAMEGPHTIINTYNGDNLRVSKTSEGKTSHFLYEYDKVVLEVDGSGNEIAQNVYGANLLKRKVGSQGLYYMYNGHGDTTTLLTASGSVAASYYYNAFGVVTESTGSANNPFLYAGYEYDSEVQLYYLKSRFYDANIARFMQEDTYRGDSRDPLSLNLYTYCSNQPLTYYDPTGHWQASDATKLTSEGQKIIRNLTEQYNKAISPIEKEKYHAMAEAVRKDPKYSATAQSSSTKKGGSAANSQGSATAVKSTSVKVLIDGQIVTGSMVNGKTTVNGKSVPVGAYVFTAGGVYRKEAGSKPSTLIASNATVKNGSTTTNAYFLQGATYTSSGGRPANGTKVTNPLGTFTMIGGKGVLDTKSTNKVADTAKDFGKGFVNGAADTAMAPVTLALNAPEVMSQMQKNLQTEWQQPNPTDSKGRTTRTSVLLAQAQNSQETYSNYSANDWGYFTGEVAVTAAVGAAAAKQAAKPKLGTSEVKGSDVNTLKMESRGQSKGGHQPTNLKEKLAVEEAMSNPGAGKVLEGKNTDPRWPVSEGWVKKAQNVNGVEVHYQYNTKTGQIDDFKIK